MGYLLIFLLNGVKEQIQVYQSMGSTCLYQKVNGTFNKARWLTLSMTDSHFPSFSLFTKFYLVNKKVLLTF